MKPKICFTVFAKYVNTLGMNLMDTGFVLANVHLCVRRLLLFIYSFFSLFSLS